MATYPLINGHRYDFSSVTIWVNGVRFTGIKEIAYKTSLEPGEVYGTSAQMIGRTRGQLKNEGSFTMYLQEFHELIGQLGKGYMEKPFDVTVIYDEDGTPLITDSLTGCRITSADKSASGTDALEVKITLSVMYIKISNKHPIAHPLNSASSGLLGGL